MDPRSESNLKGVHPALAQVVRQAWVESRQAFIVVQGVRTAAQQAKLYAQGRTAPGNIVTWVRVSNHQPKDDGFGHAVDLAALKDDGSINWADGPAYDDIKAAMFSCAAKANPPVRLRWGDDWNMNGKPREHGETDAGHFELHP